MSSKIEQELLTALGQKSKKGETRPVLLTRLLKGVTDLSDEAFDALTKGAQDWANAASKAKDAQKELPDFPDLDDGASGAKEPPMKTAAPKTTKAPAKADKAPAKAVKIEKPAKVEKAKPEAKKKGPGKLDRIRALLAKKPKLGGEDLKAAVGAAGIEVSDATIAAVRSDFLASVRVLQRAGKLKEDMVELD